MDAEIKIQLRGLCSADANVELFREATNFVASTIERVVTGEHVSAATVDPLTGEPYNSLVFDPNVVQSIRTIGVVAPSAMRDVLEKAFYNYNDFGIQIAPILIDTVDA